jgi:hypothetical protein
MTTNYHEYGDIISNAAVYGLEDTVRASKYPMAVDTTVCNSDFTDRTQKLASAPIGSGHNNYLSGIVVQFDLTCTIKMWTEFERYHFAQIVSSQSTMHRLKSMDVEKNCINYTSRNVIHEFETVRKTYLENPSEENRLRMLYSCPVGLKLTARVSTNYLQLKTMFAQRKNHPLPEWRQFCYWVTMLPHFELITGGTAND